MSISESVKAIQKAVKGFGESREAKKQISTPPRRGYREVPDFKLSFSDKSICQETISPTRSPKKRMDFGSRGSLLEPQTCEKKPKTSSIQNVRDFDDFKVLLADLKLSLSNTNFSAFNENASLGLCQLESELDRYSKLDEKIIETIGSLCSNSESARQELEALRKSSNAQTHQAKLRELRQNPSDFDSFLLKLKKEIQSRDRAFEDICFRHKLPTE